MKTAQEAAKEYTKKSFRAFLERESSCDEKWVMGIIGASTSQDITDAINSLSAYKNQDRFEFLRRACEVV